MGSLRIAHQANEAAVIPKKRGWLLPHFFMPSIRTDYPAI